LPSSDFINQFIIQFNFLVFSQLVQIHYVLYIVLAGQKSGCFSLEPDPWLHQTDIFSDGHTEELRGSSKLNTEYAVGLS